MLRLRNASIVAGVVLFGLYSFRLCAQDAKRDSRAEIEAFNKRFLDLHLKMDPGYKVAKEEMEFHDIQLCGDWATEWATEHQVAKAPEGKPDFDGYGKMALVLHREGGEWKIKQEMWNASPKP
jgi:hypothetical protein